MKDLLRLPKPKVTPERAEALISDRIKKGRRAMVQPYERDSSAAEQRHKLWDRENREFLCQLFDTDEVAVEYDSVANYPYSEPPPSPARDQELNDRFELKIKWFKELVRRINHHYSKME